MASQLKAVFTVLGVFGMMFVFFLARQNAYSTYVDKLPVCEQSQDATKSFVQGFTQTKPSCRPAAQVAGPGLWPLR